MRCADGWRADPDWTHPGDDPRIHCVVRDGVSPVELPDRTWLTPYWVHAPGHAWARVDFDHVAGGERSVELSPGRAALEVRVAGEVPANAFVRVYSLSDAPVPMSVRSSDRRSTSQVLFRRPPAAERTSWQADASTPASTSGATRLEDFAPGDYLVAVEVGESNESVRLGSTEVSLAAGASAAVTVALDAGALDVPRTHLHGTLRVPPELERGLASLSIEPLEPGERTFRKALDEMSFPRDDRETLRWDAGTMRTGKYLATVFPLQYRLTFETNGPDSETRIDLVVPPLVTVRVEVVDRASGAPVEAEVHWRGPALADVSHFTQLDALPDPTTGVLEFVATEGEVGLTASAPGYRDASRTLEVSAPTAACRVELERLSGVRISLREGEATLPVGMTYTWSVRVTDASGARVPGGRWGRGEAETLVPLEPGRYTLEFPELDGFEPVAPRVVDVPADEVVELVVQFVRAR